MRVLSLSFLLVAATLLAAQEFPTQGPATNDHTTNSSQLRTYTGCVIRSNKGIELKALPSGTFRLTSDRSLDSYVGKEVSIKAHDVTPYDPSSDERRVGVPKTQNQPVTLDVEDIQKVSETCNSKNK